MKLYEIYGLVVASELDLPELQQTDQENFDVTVKLGKAPASLPKAIACDDWVEAAAGEALVRTDPGVFWVRQGREIVVTPFPDSSPEELRLFLLGSGFGALLHQRGIFPLHASGVVCPGPHTQPGQAVLITGESGAGKSTLAAALLQHGYHLLSDDVTALLDLDGLILAQPSYPGLKLWEQSLESLQLQAGPAVRPGEAKYRVPFPGLFCSSPQPVAAVFELIPSDRAEVTLEELGGLSALELLVNNIYRRHFQIGLGTPPGQLSTLCKLIQQAKIYRVFRPAGKFSTDALAEMVSQQSQSWQIRANEVSPKGRSLTN